MVLSRLKAFWEILKETYHEWHKNYSVLLAGAISFFAIFSIVPLVILASAAAGFIIGEGNANGQILQQVQSLLSCNSQDLN